MRKSIWARKGVRSGFEDRIKTKLQSISGIRFEYEDRKYKYVKQVCKHCGEVVDSGTYTPDFNFYQRDTGEYLYTVEAKGRFVASDRKKLLAVREANPNIDLRLLFQRDDLIRKGSKTRYSTWATKAGIDYYVGEELPPQWIKDARGF